MPTLKERLLDLPRAGAVVWIGVRPEHGAPMIELAEVVAIEGRGLEGDIVTRGRGGGGRQVTLVQAEHLPVIAALAGIAEVQPEALRRNLVVAGINLQALARTRFAVGAAVFLGTGACAPCALMNETLGPLGFQAARGHGGITARVESGGVITCGAPVRLLGAPDHR